ncbi:MAG: ribonuclease J, partial [Patescibacteria group bacterium]
MNYKSSNIGGRNRPFKRRFLAPLKKEGQEKKFMTVPVVPVQKFSQRISVGQRTPPRNFPIRKKLSTPIPPPGDNIRIIPLGGVEEIGKNMTVVEYKGDIIVVDCGMQFSNENTPGVDYILPNTAYLEERKDKIRAVVITHGHLDHIGGIPYLINRLGNPPIWCREFGALLIQKRQLEHPHLPALNLKIVGADDGALPISSNLKLRFFGLTHSIPDSAGVIIETPE